LVLVDPGKTLKRIALKLIITVGLLLVSIGCGSDPVETIQFKPGTYTGTYRVAYHWLTPNEEIKMDTLLFYFISPKTFRMRFPDDGTDPPFCRANGTFTFNGISLSIDIPDDSTNPYQDICVLEEIPEGIYQYLVDGKTIIFKTSDTALNRRIELWVE
jgi:hypothetical protein